MSHESIVYGFIKGAGYGGLEHRKYQLLNLEVLQSLPHEDDCPVLVRGMFSAPEFSQRKGTFEAQVIHFGASMNWLAFEDVPVWVQKFEALLTRLYWFEAVAHIITDYIDGAYSFRWKAELETGEINASLRQPMTRWRRIDSHVPREL